MAGPTPSLLLSSKKQLISQLVPMKKLLALNRSEIAIRILRAANELGLRTVAIYSKEDRLTLHRFKADEAYLIGEGKGPVEAYLDVEGIVALAKEKGVDAIHPGYGFLSENPALAPRLRARRHHLRRPPRRPARPARRQDRRPPPRAEGRRPTSCPAPKSPSPTRDRPRSSPPSIGFPLIIKAAFGGGGRGMRVVDTPADFAGKLDEARREAGRGLRQRRRLPGALHPPRQAHRGADPGRPPRQHPAPLRARLLRAAPPSEGGRGRARRRPRSEDPRATLADAAVTLARAAGYDNAGTVEFLVDADSGEWFFIEVNPRIQVEHTVTEMVTGIDLVRAQILVAQGLDLHGPEMNLPRAGQDPAQRLRAAVPHHHRRSGQQLRAGLRQAPHLPLARAASASGSTAASAYAGAVITPFYDSLLVKVTAWGRDFPHACQRMDRALREFRIRGVKTNIPFLENVVNHPDFQAGRVTTTLARRDAGAVPASRRARDRATKLLTYLGDVIVNGNPQVAGKAEARQTSRTPPDPAARSRRTPPAGTRQLLRELGPEELRRVDRASRSACCSPTPPSATPTSRCWPRACAPTTCWRSPTSSRTALPQSLQPGNVGRRHLRHRHALPARGSRGSGCAACAKRIPNICFQMLLRASNAVGYTTYPDNVVAEFINEAAAQGIDIFRIFDSLNWLPNMKVVDGGRAQDRTRSARPPSATPATSSTRSATSTRSNYYVAHGQGTGEAWARTSSPSRTWPACCRPYAAEKLVKALREEIGMPIHFHTHDTSGINAASILKAAEAGVDIADGAVASMSGTTSQPNLNSIVAALAHTARDTGLDLDALNEFADYWEVVREYYAPFDTGPKSGTAEVYLHEMPGGQYTNLKEQAESHGPGRPLARDRAHLRRGQPGSSATSSR